MLYAILLLTVLVTLLPVPGLVRGSTCRGHQVSPSCSPVQEQQLPGKQGCAGMVHPHPVLVQGRAYLCPYEASIC